MRTTESKHTNRKVSDLPRVVGLLRDGISYVRTLSPCGQDQP